MRAQTWVHKGSTFVFKALSQIRHATLKNKNKLILLNPSFSQSHQSLHMHVLNSHKLHNLWKWVSLEFSLSPSHIQTQPHIYIPTHSHINIPWSLDLLEILGWSHQNPRSWLYSHRSSPPWIEYVIHDVTLMFPAIGLLPLLVLLGSPQLVCLSSHILFTTSLRMS